MRSRVASATKLWRLSKAGDRDTTPRMDRERAFARRGARSRLERAAGQHRYAQDARGREVAAERRHAAGDGEAGDPESLRMHAGPPRGLGIGTVAEPQSPNRVCPAS